ncbi:MFS general substrate transporter [Xylariaceae sp. AK1471]|nr:MFS general substrate transporter [Xylariaceae sp. AK1471]
MAITYQASFTAMFAALSSLIYYPAIRPLADSLDVSILAINLTVSVFLITAGIFPAIIGDVSEQIGRRPAGLVAFSIYFLANLGISLQSKYAALIALRSLQSAATAGVIIAYAVIADITTRDERGSYVGIQLGFTSSASCVGPVIGGVIAETLSWRWIFRFLVILSGANLLGLLIFFPETSRKLVGNGSLTPRSRLNQSLFSIFVSNRRTAERSIVKPRLVHVPNPLACFKALLPRSNCIIVISCGTYYALYSVIGTSLATDVAELYSLNPLKAGLIYLPSGVGFLLASLLTGKLMDHEYRVVARSLDPAHHEYLEDASSHSAYATSAFPIEKARLRSVFPCLVVTTISTLGYGWSLYARVHIAVPLVLQFLAQSTQAAIFVICSTLLTDLNPERSSAAQACYNLVKCLLSAGAVAALKPIVDSVGVGWCFTIYGGVGLLCIPMLFLLRLNGYQWRMQMVEKESMDAAAPRNDDHVPRN